MYLLIGAYDDDSTSFCSTDPIRKLRKRLCTKYYNIPRNDSMAFEIRSSL